MLLLLPVSSKIREAEDRNPELHSGASSECFEAQPPHLERLKENSHCLWWLFALNKFITIVITMKTSSFDFSGSLII